jgi:hypothetical protein
MLRDWGVGVGAGAEIERQLHVAEDASVIVHIVVSNRAPASLTGTFLRLIDAGEDALAGSFRA